jgi:hypothetical protein
MLHVTNGTSAMNRIHELGLPGHIVSWDDVLHEGPVPEGLDAAALRDVRADFIASSDWGDRREIATEMRVRDEVLASAPPDEEVVLWFEHDLYDQLQQLQVMDRLQARRAGVVTAIMAPDYLGYQTADRLREWFDRRQRITDQQWDLAVRAWAAFRASDPRAVLDVLDVIAVGRKVANPADSTKRLKVQTVAPLPSLPSAFIRLLQQYPSVRSGLSRTEAQTLTALSGGPLAAGSAYTASNHRVEEAVFMGDQGWWLHIRPLLTGPRPLIGVQGRAPADFNDQSWWGDTADTPKLAITEDGARVLAGRADHSTLNGIDRWIGGVHLRSSNAMWRWDGAARALVPGGVTG